MRLIAAFRSANGDFPSSKVGNTVSHFPLNPSIQDLHQTGCQRTTSKTTVNPPASAQLASLSVGESILYSSFNAVAKTRSDSNGSSSGVTNELIWMSEWHGVWMRYQHSAHLIRDAESSVMSHHSLGDPLWAEAKQRKTRATGEKRMKIHKNKAAAALKTSFKSKHAARSRSSAPRRMNKLFYWRRNYCAAATPASPQLITPTLEG